MLLRVQAEHDNLRAGQWPMLHAIHCIAYMPMLSRGDLSEGLRPNGELTDYDSLLNDHPNRVWGTEGAHHV